MIKIAVLGAGYAGLSFIKNLPDEIYKRCEITLVNKSKFHYHTALLHKVAVGDIDEEALFEIEEVIDKKVVFVVDEVVKIKGEEVETRKSKFKFDYLVIALGFEKDSFEIDGMDEAYEITTYKKSKELKDEIYAKFDELASGKRRNLSVVVCGGGLTGVEFAGALATKGRKYAEGKFEFENMQIYLVEALARILPMYDENLYKTAVKILSNLGVKVLENSKIIAKNKDEISLENGEKILADIVVWTAGIKGSGVIEASEFKNQKCYLKVDEWLKINQNIFAIGDVARFENFAPTAQIACQMGAYLGENINLHLEGKIAPKFSYNNKGLICSIGKNSAVGTVFGRNISGKFAVFLKFASETKWDLALGGFLNSCSKIWCKFRKFAKR